MKLMIQQQDTPPFSCLIEHKFWLYLCKNVNGIQNQWLTKLTNLKYVRINDTPIGDGLVLALGGKKFLGELDLRRTPITDGAFQDLRPLERLRILNLEGTSLSDSVLPYLLRHPELQVHKLGAAKMTEESVVSAWLASPAARSIYEESESSRKKAEKTGQYAGFVYYFDSSKTSLRYSPARSSS